MIAGLLLDNNYPQLANNFFSTLFLLDNNYPQLTNNGICLIQFGSDLFSLAQICFVLFCSMVQTPVNSEEHARGARFDRGSNR